MSETSHGAHSAPNPYIFEVTSEQLAACYEAQQALRVPQLELGKDPTRYPKAMLHFMRDLWDENGHSPILEPHTELMVALPSAQLPPMLFFNRYYGLTVGQVRDREPWLKHYRDQGAALRTIPRSDTAAHAVQAQKLSRILGHISDVAGSQGIESYRLFIPQSPTPPWQFRLGTGVNVDMKLTIDKHHTLGPEARKYGLSTSVPNQPHLSPYPHIAPRKPILNLDTGSLFADLQDPNLPLEEVAADWTKKLTFIVSLLQNRVVVRPW